MICPSLGRVNRPSEILCELWSMNWTRIPIVTSDDTASSATISARSIS
jgi:hypothetical protein